MLTELRTKSQITIPKDIVARLGLHEGDKLEIVEKDGLSVSNKVPSMSNITPRIILYASLFYTFSHRQSFFYSLSILSDDFSLLSLV